VLVVVAATVLTVVEVVVIVEVVDVEVLMAVAVVVVGIEVVDVVVVDELQDATNIAITIKKHELNQMILLFTFYLHLIQIIAPILVIHIIIVK